METESIEVSAVLPADPYRIYQAYLNGLEHAAMTGGAASIEPWPGGRFSVWDGYITGTTLDVDPSRRILQSWRTTDFPPEAPDSRVEITLEPVEGGTRLSITHSDIPKGQGRRYASGWHDYYLNPMAAYFSAATPREGAAAAQATVKAPRRRRRRRPTITERPTRRSPKAGTRKPAGNAAGRTTKPATRKTARNAAKKKAAKKAPARNAAKKKTAKKKAAKKKTAKKAARKPARKAARKKAAKKAPARKAARKKIAKKPPRKTAKKKTAKKTARKPVRKAAKKKAAKKTAARKPARKSGGRRRR